jgi:hypothetical protein
LALQLRQPHGPPRPHDQASRSSWFYVIVGQLLVFGDELGIFDD